ncbi:MAG TPA: YncE family protein [Chloroflexota bacterium]
MAGLAPTQETAPLRALVSVPNGAWAVAVAPSLRRAYVTSRESDAVTFVDLDQNRVEQTVTIGPDPHNLVVDEAAGRLYVTLHGGTSALRGDAVAVLDATTGAVLAKWPTGPFPAQIDLDPNLGRLFVVNEGDSTITVLDTQSGAEVQRIGVAGSGTDVAVSPPTGHVYVTTWPARLLVTLDGRTGETLAQTPLGQMPLRIAVNPVTERVYVGDGTTPGADRGELWTVDGRTQVATSRRLGWLPLGIGVDPEGDTVLATDARLGLLSVLDGTGQEIRWQGAVGAGPHTIVPSRALGRAYVVISATNTLGVLDWPLPAR